MKLHQLTLRHFRGVADRRITLPDHGVVVIEGANEIGKSSMIEALDLLLEEKDGSGKAQVKSIKPVNADVGTSVEAEISTGQYRFLYRKQWNRSSETVLTIFSPVREQLTGVPAHERVRAILAETMDDKLFKASRVMQAAPLHQTNLGESGALVSALDRVAGAAADPARGETLVAAVEAEYRRYFTTTNRPTLSFRTVLEDLKRARAAAERAVEQLAEVSQGAAHLEAAIVGQGELQQRKQAAEQELVAVQTKWELVEELQRTTDLAAGLATRAAAAAERAGQDQHRRAELIENAARRSVRVDELTRLAVTVAAEVEEASDSVARLTADCAERSAAVVLARSVAVLARSDAEYLQDTAELAALTRTLDEIDACATTITSAREVRDSVPVDDASLKKIETAARAVDLAVDRQRTAAAQVHLEPLADLDLIIDGHPVQLDQGHTADLAVTGDVKLELPGLLRVTVRPPTGARALAEAVAAAKQVLREHLDRATAGDIDHAKELHERRRRAQDDLARAEARLGELSDGHTLEDLVHRCRRLQEEVSAYAGQRAAEPALPATSELGRKLSRAAQAALLAAESADAAAHSTLVKARDRHTALELKLAKLDTEILTQGQEITALRQTLEAARTLLADDLLLAEMHSTRDEAGRATTAADQLRAELTAAEPATVRAQMASCRLAVDRLVRESTTAATEISRLRGHLEAIGAQGRQDVFDQAQTELVAAERNHQRISERAAAARLLHETMQSHRAKAKAHYVAPFREEVVRLGKMVHGAAFDVEIDADLRIVSRTVEGITVRFDQLSTGAKEQLAIMIRLACAAVVGDDGVPVILDDALGYADPDRLRLMGRIFAGAGETAQVILLTCTPERYRGIDAAKVIRLGAEPDAQIEQNPVNRQRATDQWPPAALPNGARSDGRLPDTGPARAANIYIADEPDSSDVDPAEATPPRRRRSSGRPLEAVKDAPGLFNIPAAG